MPVKRVSDLVEALPLLHPEVARVRVEGVGLEEKPDLVAGIEEVVVLGLRVWRDVLLIYLIS